MNRKELTRAVVIALIFFGIGAATAESNLYTFTLSADRVLADYIGGNAKADKVNITGLIIQAGHITGYYNESDTDGLLKTKADLSHNHPLRVSNVSGLQDILTDKSNTTHHHNISDSNITAGINASKIGNGMVDNIEFGQLNGVTSAIQTQINNKFDSTNHTKPTHDALRIDADTLDNLNSSQFERIDANWTNNSTLSANKVYRNGNFRAFLAVIVAHSNQYGVDINATILTDVTNPPTTEKAKIIHSDELKDTNYAELSMMVPIQPNDYFKIEVSSGTLVRAELFY